MAQWSSPTSVYIDSFNGVDAYRDVDDNQGYDEGVLAENLGRQHRRPLEPRVGLRPVTADANAEVAGPVFAMGCMPQGGRLNIVMRLNGGRLVAAQGVRRA